MRITAQIAPVLADNLSAVLDDRDGDGVTKPGRPRTTTRTVAVEGGRVGLQVAILKVLASHASGRATLASLNRDIAILSGSGPEWNARIKRLAARVPAIDIFGCRYVLRDSEGWQITEAGRQFLAALEAITQDNRPPVESPRPPDVVRHPRLRKVRGS